MDQPWQIDGLPLHPLLVHAVVVLVPLAAVAVAGAQFWPALRRRAGIAVPLLAVAVAALVPVTIEAGEQLKDVVGALPRVLDHEDDGRTLLPWTIALAVVAVVQWLWFRLLGAARDDAGGGPIEDGRLGLTVAWVLGVAAGVTAIGAIVAVILAGHSGSEAVWTGVL